MEYVRVLAVNQCNPSVEPQVRGAGCIHEILYLHAHEILYLHGSEYYSNHKASSVLLRVNRVYITTRYFAFTRSVVSYNSSDPVLDNVIGFVEGRS